MFVRFCFDGKCAYQEKHLTVKLESVPSLITNKEHPSCAPKKLTLKLLRTMKINTS